MESKGATGELVSAQLTKGEETSLNESGRRTERGFTKINIDESRGSYNIIRNGNLEPESS